MNKHSFPHSKNGLLRGIKGFKIGEKYLYLYSHIHRSPTTSYSLYWEDESNPVQHNMSLWEVLGVISLELEKVGSS